MGQFSQFFRELKRRNVFRAGVAFLILAWLVVQIADVLLDAFESPSWIIQSIVVAFAVGFPVTLVLAWVYEITTTGVKRTEDVAIGESITELTGRKLDFIVIGVLVVAVAMFAFDKFVVSTIISRPSTSNGNSSYSIGLLPFQAESEGVQKHFAQISIEVARYLRRSNQIRLASADALSALPSNGSLVENATQLGVRYLVVGALTIAEGNLHLNLNLFDHEKDEVVWTNDYQDAQLSQTSAIIAQDLSTFIGTDSNFIEQTIIDPEAYESYLKARQLLRVDSFSEEGESLIKSALKISGRFPSALATLCDMYLRRYVHRESLEDFSSAESSCLRAWTLDNGSPEVLYSLGHLSEESGQTEQARDYFGRALSISPEYLDAQVSLAATYIIEEPEFAEIRLKSITAMHPGSPTAYKALQHLYFLQGRADEAVELQRWIISLNPENEIEIFRQSSNLMLAGMFTEAKSLLSAMLENESLLIGDIHSNLATILFFDEDYEEAADLYRQAIDREPENVMFHRNLGDAIWHLDGRDAAQEIFRTVVRLSELQLRVNPSNRWSLMNLVVAHGSLGDLDGYTSVKSKLLIEFASDPQVHYCIAVSASRLGEMDTSKLHAERALELGFPMAFLGADPDIALAGVSF